MVIIIIDSNSVQKAQQNAAYHNNDNNTLLVVCVVVYKDWSSIQNVEPFVTVELPVALLRCKGALKGL